MIANMTNVNRPRYRKIDLSGERQLRSRPRHPLGVRAQHQCPEGAPDEVAEFLFVSDSGTLAAVGSESSVKVGCLLVEQLVGAGVVGSKNEARRLVEQGAIAVDGARVSDPHASLAVRAEAYLVKVGKRRFVKLQIH